MTFPTGTILTRTDPKGDKLDRLEVVGPSPISRTGVGEWAGAPGESLVVNPAGEDFGGPEVLPIRIAAEQYDVEYEPDPEPTHVTSQRRGIPERQLSPEEQFRSEAKRPKKDPKVTRERTPIKSG